MSSGADALCRHPAPGPSTWTGALVASLLHEIWQAFIGAILVGIALATVIMSILSYGIAGRAVWMMHR